MVKANHITSLSASQKNTANPAIQSAMEAVLDEALEHRNQKRCCAKRANGNRSVPQSLQELDRSPDHSVLSVPRLFDLALDFTGPIKNTGATSVAAPIKKRRRVPTESDNCPICTRKPPIAAPAKGKASRR